MNKYILPDSASGTELIPVNRLPAEYQPFPHELEERQSSLQLANLLRILYRWRWVVLATALLCVAVSTLIAALQTPLYRATATLELNPDPAQVVRAEEADEEARQSDRDFLALQIGLIKSRAVAEAVTRRLDLSNDEQFHQQPIEQGGTEAAVGRLAANFSATGTNSDRIMQISFVHPDPQVAAKVVNGFAEQAVDTNIERSFSANTRSRQYLQQRLEATRRELEKSERDLIAYARQANIVNVVGGEGTPTSGDTAGGTLLATNLIKLNEQLAEAENARIVAQQRYAQAGASSQAASASDPTVQNLQQQLAQLQTEYQQKSQQYLPDYPEMIALRARVQGLEQQIRQASGRTSSSNVASLRAEMVAAQNREGQLRSRINQLESQVLDLGERGVQYTILRRAVDANRSLYNALLARLGEENSSATRTSSISIVDTAKVPGAPFTPNIPRAIILGLLAGLTLGGALAVALEKWYDTIDVPDDLRDLLGIPLLGVIPKMASRENVDDQLADPRSPLSEAYHSVRASLQFIGSGRPPSSILMTSSRAGEGKTSSTIALAADFLSVKLSVVVIDADLRRPSLRGARSGGGLSSLLSGERQLSEVLSATGSPGLYLIESGATPADPTVLLASEGFADLIAQLSTRFDVVVIDGPPVMGLADAPLISSVAQATVLIVESGSTRRSVAASALRRLKQGGGTVVGGVLTKFNQRQQGYGYGYGYDYGGGAGKEKRPLIGYRGSKQSAAG